MVTILSDISRRTQIGAGLLKKEGKMANIMIKCPYKRRLFSTGMSMDKKSFDTAKLENNTLGCPACGGKHIWSKKDAVLKD